MFKPKNLEAWLGRSGWPLIIFIVMLPYVRWLHFAGFHRVIEQPALMIAAMAKLGGICGLMLMAVSLILSVRTKWLERLFGGLSRVYQAHHACGAVAWILILLHPVFLLIRELSSHTISGVTAAISYFLPHASTVASQPMSANYMLAYNAGIIASFSLSLLLLVTLYIKIPYDWWRRSHKLMGVVFFIALVHALLISSQMGTDYWLKIYYALWGIAALTTFFYRVVFARVLVVRKKYRLEKVSNLPGKVTALSLSPTEGGIRFKPGQFVYVNFAPGQGQKTEQHPFSVASAPNEKNLRLYIKQLGNFTNKLPELKSGLNVEVEGAFGSFGDMTNGRRPQIWIAGGIGVAPFLSLARSMNENSPAVDMFYSVNTKDELLDQELLGGFLPKHFKNFRYFPFINDQHKGFLDLAFIASKAGDPAGRDIFICGPPPMMKALKAQLRAAGIPPRRIFTEEFSL